MADVRGLDSLGEMVLDHMETGTWYSATELVTALFVPSVQNVYEDGIGMLKVLINLEERALVRCHDMGKHLYWSKRNVIR